MLAAFLVFVLSVVATAAAAPSAPVLDPLHLPALPAQGLVIEQKGGVLLETTAGKVIGRLPGFSVYPPPKLPERLFPRSVGIQALAQADPWLTVLFDRQGAGWLLDPVAGKLRKIGPLRVPLAPGASLEAVVTTHGAGVDTRMVVRRHGKVVLSGLFVHVVGGRYASTDDSVDSRPNEVVDVVTGRRMQLGARCILAGIDGGTAYAACAPRIESTKSASHLYSYSGGGKRLLATLPKGLVGSVASLSPDTRWVLLYLQPFCGAGWVAFFPTAGGPARLAVGGPIPTTGVPATSVPHTSFLGWTSDGQAAINVARLDAGSGCEGLPETGVSLVDPATLDRVHASPLFASMLWGSS